MAEINVTTANFEQEVLKADIPVLVDFWAAWCGPCRMVAPVIAEIAEEKKGSVKVCKVNVDEEPELAEKYRVSGIPTIICFKNGQAVSQVVGYRPKQDILKLL
jgi:thioredoxin 1